MGGDFFFVIGIVLVIAAVALAFLGIRESDRFPANRAALVGVTGLFTAIVAGTMAFAVVKSEDEQEHREAELAKEEAQPENTGEAQPVTPGGQPQASGGGPRTQTSTETDTQAAIPSEMLEVSSPADGALVFEPNGLEAKPGNLTIDYDNPSPVPHSIAVVTANGDVLGETQPATGGVQTLQISDLTPGKYIFYCTVPGHREAGMEGDLTVTGGPAP
ncbi:MAG TPA: plastocyanin/azurin family copper-binding protein [Solirubrobacterales bacterium]|nr:plastocyanin/azurin family copper-binding protein [Solirubrobacterales bacterium]